MNWKKAKRIVKRIFFLPPGWTLVISIPSYGFVIYALVCENVKPEAAYLAYTLSAYAFTITITGIMGIVSWARTGIENHPFVKKVLSVPFF